MAQFDYPGDLLIAQRNLQAVRDELAVLLKALPYSVEPMDAWARPEGYWLAKSRSYPDSPGWSDSEQEQVATLRKRELDLTGVVVAHGFWSSVAGPERPDARSGLRHAALAAPAGPDGGAQVA